MSNSKNKYVYRLCLITFVLWMKAKKTCLDIVTKKNKNKNRYDFKIILK